MLYDAIKYSINEFTTKCYLGVTFEPSRSQRPGQASCSGVMYVPLGYTVDQCLV